jgi:TRAP-type C4-dicarboxylate transport system substrate-binding protein
MHATFTNGQTTRRRLLATATALAAPSLPRFAHAAEVTWRLAHTAPTDFPLHTRLLEAATTIAARSDGKMTLQVHPDNELGGTLGLLAQLRAGTIDAVPLSSQTLGNDLVVAFIPTVGFAFNGYDQLWNAIDGGIGQFLRSRLKERLGLVTMDRCFDFGFRQITTTTKIIETAQDLQGLKLRTPSEANLIGLFQALKALPMAMTLSEMLQALPAHAIDGQESVLPLISAAGLQKQQSRCALTNHVWDGQWLCVSEKSWSKLPSNLQDVVASAFNEGALKQRQDIAGNDATIRQKLTEQGMTINPVDPVTFRAMLHQAGYYAAWKTKMGDDAWAALEQYTGTLT